MLILNTSASVAKETHLSLLRVIPFALILLSIAIVPLISAHFWEYNLCWISLFVFTLPVLVPPVFFLGSEIRPLLRANRNREMKAHIVVFIIFLVSNIGGILTPLGDPPLFPG